LQDPPIDNLAELIEEAARSLRPFLRPPFAFFGHSMGSLIAFELCRKLRTLQWPSPECLFVSGMRGPNLPRFHAPRYNLPESALIQELRAFDGTPEAVFQDGELMELIVPTFRADLAICDRYEFLRDRPLQLPICAFAGHDDPEAPPAMVDAWREQTLREFSLHVISGGHFFINSARQAVLDIIGSELLSLSDVTRAPSPIVPVRLELKGEPA
jgi:medium-chain acyl-[acyl-carrier-protein] hydrolase